MSIDNLDDASTVEDVIAHFGVKGMKWGVRKTAPPVSRSTEDIVLKKGTQYHNITNIQKYDGNSPVYVSHTNKDILNYRAQLAPRRLQDSKADGANEGKGEVFERTFPSTKAVKAPSEQKAYDAFKKTYEKDPEALLRDLAASRKDMYVSSAIAHKVFKRDRDEVYYNKLVKKGDDWVTSQKGVNQFESSLGTEGSRNSKSKTMYFSELSRQGYNAILDTNDTRNYGSEQPLLIFNAGKTLGKPTTVPLTKTEIQNAVYLNNILTQPDAPKRK